MGLISKEVPPEPPVRPGGRRACPRRLGAAHAGRPPPTLATGLPAEALRRRSPNAVAVFAAHAQASD